eukprot:gene10987-3693_t
MPKKTTQKAKVEKSFKTLKNHLKHYNKIDSCELEVLLPVFLCVENELQVLNTFFKNRKYIKQLKLLEDTNSEQEDKLIFSKIKKYDNINHLYFSASLFNGITYLSDFIKNTKRLHELTIDCFIQFDHFQQLFDALLVNKTIRKLSFPGCRLSTDHSYIIAKYLKDNDHLEYLNLERNDINIGLYEISKSLTSNTSLTELNLSANFLDKKQNMGLKQIMKNNSTLKTLDLSKNDLFYSWSLNETITCIDLSKNYQEFTKNFFLNAKSLKKLTISKNLSPKILEAILKLPSFEDLVLKDYIGQDIDILSIPLQNSTNLKRLDISAIDLKGSINFYESNVPQTNSLTELHLFDSWDWKYRNEIFLNFLKKFPNLKNLTIESSCLDNFPFRQILLENTSLITLDFGNADICKEDIEEIMLALKENETITQLRTSNSKMIEPYLKRNKWWINYRQHFPMYETIQKSNKINGNVKFYFR